MANTGHGGTAVLSATETAATATIGTVRSISLGEMTTEEIDTTALSTTDFMTSIPGDLSSTPTVTVEAIFKTDDDIVAATGTVETMTITFPKEVATNTSPATYSGTGYITSVTPPSLQTNELQVQSYVFKFDGETGPTFTAES